MLWEITEYRLTPDVAGAEDNWTQMPRRPFDGFVRHIVGLPVGKKYDVRVRLYDDVTGKFGPFATRTGITVTRPNRTPPPPVDVRQTTGGCLSWRLAEPSPTVVGFKIRHAPAPHDTWSTMEPAHERLVAGSPWPLCELPGGDRAIGIVSVDTWGNESLPAVVNLKVRELDDKAEHTILEQDEEDAGYGNGSLAGGLFLGSQVDASQTSTADGTAFWPSDLAPFWTQDEGSPFWVGDDLPFWRDGSDLPFWSGDDTVGFWSVRYRWLEYVWTFEVPPCHAGTSVRMTVDVATTAPNAPARILYRRPGGGAGPEKPALFWDENEFADFWTSDAADFWTSGENEGWRAWPGRIEGVRGGRYRFRVLVPGGAKQGSILAAVARLSVPGRSEVFESVTIPAGGGRVAPSTPFRRVQIADVSYRDGTPSGVRVDVGEKDRTRGPELLPRDASGNDSSAVCDVTIRGY